MASGTGGRSCANDGVVAAASARASASDSATRECLSMSLCSWVSVDDQGGAVCEALVPQRFGVDEWPIAGDDVRHELPRCRADAETVPGEAGGDVKARQ